MKKTILMILAIILPHMAAAQTPTDLYQTALSARVAGRADIALQILDELEARYPLSARIRFEKGVALAQLGRCAAAARSFNAGKDLTRLPSYDRAVEDAMNDLCPRLSRFETSLSASIVAQTNQNGGSENKTVIINGTSFDLSDDAVAQAGSHFNAYGSVAYNHPISHRGYLVPSVALSAQVYDDQDMTTLTPQAGISYRYRGDRNDIRVGPSFSRSFKGGSIYSDTVEFGLSGAFTLSRASGLSYGVSRRSQHITGASSPDVSNIVSAIYRRALSGGRQFGVQYSRVNTDSPNYTRDLSQQTLRVSLTGSFKQRYGYELSTSYTKLHGEVVDPFFGEAREDDAFTIGAKVSLPAGHSILGRPYVGLSYMRNKSNFATKDFRNTSIAFGVTRSF